MTVKDGLIMEATQAELEVLYHRRSIDEVMPFEQFVSAGKRRMRG